VLLAPLACGPHGSEAVEQVYLPRSAHQAYGHALAQANLTQAALGRDWLAAGRQALTAPTEVSVPFQTSGRFEAATAQASGYAFAARSGQRIDVVLGIDSSAGLDVFVDLFRVTPDGGLDHAASAAPAPSPRVQPELLREGAYQLSIQSGPSIAFPVDGLDMGAILSVFGAERDGGIRSHRGVDIFAERGTPALAGIDAFVSRVETTRRGGNVVWLQDLFSPLRLYYAHLDSQAVVPGQLVRAGDVVGTVGNTGNARTTPPHLHFGVYVRRRGPRDPTLFLQ
jgi:murein DD-endopeptidase MepM/ murein hydrolase activator NlpD